MKKLYIMTAAAAAMLIVSCKSMDPTPPFLQVAYALDYQKAGKGRVFITEANSVSFEYEPIASLVVVEESGKVVTKVEEVEEKSDEIYGKESKIRVETKGYRNANPYSALEFAVEQCEKMGGNGIINLKSRTIDIGKVEVTGMVIRRK